MQYDTNDFLFKNRIQTIQSRIKFETRELGKETVDQSIESSKMDFLSAVSVKSRDLLLMSIPSI